MLVGWLYPWKFMFALFLSFAYLEICCWCYMLRAVIVLPIWLLCREKPFNVFFAPNWTMMGKWFAYPKKEKPNVTIEYWYI